MAFFRDRAVNLLNLHYGIHSIALSGGGAFFFVYLLKAGQTHPQIALQSDPDDSAGVTSTGSTLILTSSGIWTGRRFKSCRGQSVPERGDHA
jgi:hypothetical protein